MSANKSLYLRHRLLTTGLLTLFLLMAWLWSSQLNDQEGERIAVIINAEKLVHELSELFINKSTTDELSKRINYDKRIVKLASHLDDLYLGKERFYFGNGKQRLSSPPTQKSEQIISKARAVVQSMIKEAASLQGFNNYQPTDKINGLKVNLATLRMEEIEHKNSMLIKSRILLILFVLSFIAAFISLIYEQKRLFKKLLPSIIRDNHEGLNAYEEVHPLNVEIATLRSTQKEATLIAEKIGNSEFDISFTNINVKSGLGRALLEMRDKLKNLAREEYERNWVVNGIAEFGSKLRNNQELSLKQLSELLISDLVRYLEADQGAIYLFHENDESTDFPYLQMVSCYAHDRKKKPFENKIRVGEGLVGQSIQERDTLFLSEIPEDYSYLFSGLGGSKPRFVVVVPVIYNDKILGVIEIGAFNEINDYKVEFLKKFTDSFGSTVSAVSTSEITKKLLADSQAKAKELATQEEAMRQNAEELQATQEELNRNLRQIEKEAALNESILQAINKTNATLEMDLDGVITDVNDIYLSLMEYKKEEMIGKREKEFVTSDQLENNRYEMMWSSIRDGAFNSGEFKRISKSGKELWLTGTYSPIFDVDGVPYKIVQFAQFTTEQKERELELNSKLNAFNSSIPILEIKPDGSIIKGNTPFLDSFGYKRIAIRKMHFFDLFDASVDEKIRSEISSQFENDTSFKLDLVLRSADKKQRSYIANFTPTRNLAGVLNGYMVVLVDITEQRNLRNQLRDLLTAERRKVALLELEKQNSEKFAHEFVDIMLKLEQKSANNEIYAFLKEKKVPIGEVNISGEMNFCNDPFANLFGEIRSDFIGKKVVDYMVFPTEAENNIFHEMLEDEKLRQAKLYFKISEDTEPVLFNTYIVPSYKEENNELFKLLLLMNVEQINPDRTYG